MRILARLVFCAMIAAGLAAASSAQDLTPEQIVAKHLEAVGKKEKRDSAKSLMALGYSTFEMRNPTAKGGGKAVVVSNADNLFFVISLNSKEYPFEKIGYFDGKVSLPFISSGTRSLLGSFLSEHNKILTEGLFGGTMSLRWTQFDPEKRKATLKYVGTKKINGRKSYVLDCFPSGVGSNEFTIRLYFDTETFYHLRSEYRLEVSRREGVFGQANQQTNATAMLSEDFSEFRPVEGLMLPHIYKASFVSNSNSLSNENIWGIEVVEYRVNQALAPGFFTFDAQ